MPPVERVQGGLMPFWMLCDASTVEEKKAYMRRCRAGGIKALTLHPRPGNLVPFASTEWFDMIRELAAEAARLDMKLWLYDEDPYPSGAAGGLVMAERPDLRARHMEKVEMPAGLKTGELWFIDRRRVVWAGLVPLRAGLEPRDLTAQVGPVRADWFATDWDSRWYYNGTPLFKCVRGHATRLFHTMRVPEVPAGYRLAAIVEAFGGLEGPWGSLPDLLNPETYGVFQRLGLDPYVTAVGSHFGTTIPGIFTDEAKPHGSVPLTKDLFASFRQQFGYDLLPKVALLFGDPLDDATLRLRIDYRRWIMDRFMGGFVNPYRAWCDRHNLHLVGHFSPEDDPVQETACLPSCMAIMKAMSFPGCDVIIPAVGDESCPTLNLGSLRIGSIKSQSGRRYCASESQALGDWVITSRQTRQIYAWQKALGVDRFYTHGFWNSLDGITNLEAPPDYGPNSSIFRGTSAVNAWLERCDAAMDGGVERAETAVLDNITAFWIWGQSMDPSALGSMRTSLWMTLLHALQAQAGIHVLDAADAAKATVGDQGLTFGKRTYRTILVPAGGIMQGPVFRRLQEAAAAGVRVVWFNEGPAKLVEESGPLAQAPAPAGEVRREREPSLAWCRQNLPPQVVVKAAAAKNCYVRRFRAEDGRERLFAVNMAKDAQVFTLEGEGDLAWNPDPLLADGATVVSGPRTGWNVPGFGCGLFTLGEPQPAAVRVLATRPAGAGIAFERLGPNSLRLDRCLITLKGRPTQERPYPQPFWQRFPKDFNATETFGTFGGDLPVESTVLESDLRYAFRVESKAALRKAVLVLDPRCARGRFQVLCNGRKVGGVQVFPVASITPVKLPVTNIKKGTNAIEFRFDVKNAMEGLLCTVWLEGDFGVRVRNGKPFVEAQSGRVSPKGWLDMGLAHYMGDGAYRWTESFAEKDLAGGVWTLELDEVMDSATLKVNGVEQGTLAWAPWRWELKGLKPRANEFELTVSSTAGNRLQLEYPAQPQGWMGKGRLVRRG